VDLFDPYETPSRGFEYKWFDGEKYSHQVSEPHSTNLFQAIEGFVELETMIRFLSMF
jgi:hypothetical protein